MPISLSDLSRGTGRITADDGLSMRSVVVVQNDTGAAIDDLHLDTNNTDGDDPDMKIVTIYRQNANGERTKEVGTKGSEINETFMSADITLSEPIPSGETFQVVIRFDGDFESDEFLTIKPTIGGAKVVSKLSERARAVPVDGPVGIGSGGSTTNTGGTPGAVNADGSPSVAEGKCTRQSEDAELAQMLALYEKEVHDRRSQGWQAGDDPGYSDPGQGMHKVGNCADWARVSWAALVVRTWKCWRVEKIVAREHWTARSYHNFVRLTGVATQRVIYLDPWKSGKPDRFTDQDFECSTGWHMSIDGTHNPGDAPRDPAG